VRPCGICKGTGLVRIKAEVQRQKRNRYVSTGCCRECCWRKIAARSASYCDVCLRKRRKLNGRGRSGSVNFGPILDTSRMGRPIGAQERQQLCGVCGGSGLVSTKAETHASLSAAAMARGFCRKCRRRRIARSSKSRCTVCLKIAREDTARRKNQRHG
jgi:hypothetical protein